MSFEYFANAGTSWAYNMQALMLALKNLSNRRRGRRALSKESRSMADDNDMKSESSEEVETESSIVAIAGIWTQLRTQKTLPGFFQI